MADRFESGQGWAFNFHGEPYLDPVVDYTDPFAFPEFADLTFDILWAENQRPIPHCPISMDLFSGSDLQMEGQTLALHESNFNEMKISGDINVSLSYNMILNSGSQTNSSTSGMVTPSTLPESSVSPFRNCSMQALPLPVTSKRSRPEDYQSEFMGPEPVAPEKRRRRAYQTGRKMEVGMIRQIGACVRCKIMKTPVR